MKKRAMIMSVLLCVLSMVLQAAQVDTVLVKSLSMNKEVEVVYVLPDKAVRGEACPAVYLLHGYGGDARSWVALKPELLQIADEKGFIFVCPDAENSWYWDSPRDESYRYETFVSTELVRYTDGRYTTIPTREARAISGLSMGGHGALWIAIRHKEVFGAAGCMSGGVDIRPFPQNWEMKKQLGEFASNKAVWDAHTVVEQLDRIENKELALTIDCGEDDFFLEVNKELHSRLSARKIEHDFTVRPGGHTGAYWQNSIDYHILFFEKFFKK